MNPKPRWYVRVLWCSLYAVLCAAEFVLDKLKDAVEERITGKEPDDDEDDEDDEG
jgi:hypothetical protein